MREAGASAATGQTWLTAAELQYLTLLDVCEILMWAGCLEAVARRLPPALAFEAGDAGTRPPVALVLCARVELLRGRLDAAARVVHPIIHGQGGVLANRTTAAAITPNAMILVRGVHLAAVNAACEVWEVLLDQAETLNARCEAAEVLEAWSISRALSGRADEALRLLERALAVAKGDERDAQLLRARIGRRMARIGANHACM